VAALADFIGDVEDLQRVPARRTSTPSWLRSFSARFTVMRETPSSRTSSCSEGTRLLATSSPDAILSRTCAFTFWYRGNPAAAARCMGVRLPSVLSFIAFN
jgi:hypothetical protein